MTRPATKVRFLNNFRSPSGLPPTWASQPSNQINNARSGMLPANEIKVQAGHPASRPRVRGWPKGASRILGHNIHELMTIHSISEQKKVRPVQPAPSPQSELSLSLRKS